MKISIILSLAVVLYMISSIAFSFYEGDSQQAKVDMIKLVFLVLFVGPFIYMLNKYKKDFSKDK